MFPSRPFSRRCPVICPGKRPTGKENAAIIKRVLRLIRLAWPDTHIILRGDSHFANPELMTLCRLLADSQPAGKHAVPHELARAQPMTIILKLFKLAVRVVKYKDRIKHPWTGWP